MKTLLISLLIFSSSAFTTPNEKFVTNEKSDIVHSIADLFSQWYIDENAAKVMESSLLSSLKNGKYDQYQSRKDFTNALVKELHTIVSDKHIQIHFVPNVSNSKNKAPKYKPMFSGDDTGISNVTVLPNGIGKMKITRFSPDSKSKQAFVNAFKSFREQNAKAIVIDLRDCMGGNGDAVNWVLAHFLDENPIHLTTVKNRKMGIEKENWSLGTDKVSSKLRFKQPLYILTSNDTFSGGEAFAYALKHLKRATIIGENTGGAANMVTSMKLEVTDENQNTLGYYDLLMPFIEITNAITGTNWEKIGVIPNVRTNADDAWETAFDIIENSQS